MFNTIKQLKGKGVSNPKRLASYIEKSFSSCAKQKQDDFAVLSKKAYELGKMDALSFVKFLKQTELNKK